MFSLTAVIGLWEHQVGALPGEHFIVSNAFHRTTNGDVVQSTYFVANLGTPAIALLSVGLVAYFVWSACGLPWGLLAPICAVAGPIAEVVKSSTGPTKYQAATGLLPGNGGSLPSGHTAYVTSLFSLVVILALRRGHRDIALAAAIPIAAIGPSLVVKGAHYPGDIAAGYTLGLGWTFTGVGALLWLLPTRPARD